jgi:putative toxin-antitoxin system antitoxin component (TIGR02293 family)
MRTASAHQARPKKIGAGHKGTKHRRRAVVEMGFSGIHEFDHLKKISGYSAEVLASFLGTTSRTLQNKRTRHLQFDLPLTERLRKLIQLFQQGIEIFGKPTEFSGWLEKPAYGLDMLIPVELLRQPGGLDLVSRELIAIKYGETI